MSIRAKRPKPDMLEVLRKGMIRCMHCYGHIGKRWDGSLCNWCGGLGYIHHSTA